MAILFLDVYKILVYLGSQPKNLLDVNILFQNFLPELASLNARLLNHLLKLDVDFLEFNDRLDLKLDLEASRVEFALILAFLSSL